MNTDSLETVLQHELNDLYDAESQILAALPQAIEAASAKELKAAFEEHRKVTERHVERLDQIFGALGLEPNGESCRGMAGLIEESQAVIGAEGNGAPKDAALIAAAQRIEHYEIAAYGCARTHARQLGEMAVSELLQTTLTEEGTADELLSHLAEYLVNPRAAGTDGIAVSVSGPKP